MLKSHIKLKLQFIYRQLCCFIHTETLQTTILTYFTFFQIPIKIHHEDSNNALIKAFVQHLYELNRTERKLKKREIKTTIELILNVYSGRYMIQLWIRIMHYLNNVEGGIRN